MKAGTKLLLVGCGKMGGALLRGLAGKIVACVVDPAAPSSALKSLADTSWFTAPDQIPASFQPDIIVLAIKPQLMTTTLPAYAGFEKSAFLSIAAGISINSIEKLLQNDSCSIVRSMPNLPASIGQGISVAVANRHVSSTQRELCNAILSAVGETAWLDDESLIDSVTALSGSGPAYIFALCEAMAKAGEVLGFTEAMANRLARQTVIGSSAMLAQSPESASSLRNAVTSPGGTTEAALKVLLMQGGLNDLLLKAMTAAVERAKELARLA